MTIDRRVQIEAAARAYSKDDHLPCEKPEGWRDLTFSELELVFGFIDGAEWADARYQRLVTAARAAILPMNGYLRVAVSDELAAALDAVGAEV